MASPITILSGFITSLTRGPCAVAEDLVHGDQVLREPLDVGEHGVARQRDVQQRAGERCRGRQELAFDREDLVDPPAGDIGKGEQSQRLAGWARSRRRSPPILRTGDGPGAATARTARPCPGGRSAPRPRCGRSRARANSSLSQSWTPDQWRSISSWALDLLPPQIRSPIAPGSGADRAAEGVGQAVSRIGGDHQRSQSRGRASARRARRD